MSYENDHTKEMERSDDLFANSSNETVIDNIDFSAVLQEADEFLKLNQCLGNQHGVFPISPHKQPRNTSIVKETKSNHKSKTNVPETLNLSHAVELIVTDVCDTIKQLYCPFCPLYFAFESSLTDHLKACHSKELGVLVLGDTAILLHPCPLCNAKFYMKLLLPKHILHSHQQAVILMLQENQSDHLISCKFCSFKVLTRHSKLLLNHMEKKHCVEFEHFVRNKFSNESNLSRGKCDKSSNNMLHICSLKMLTQLSNEQCVGNDMITNDAKLPLKPILKSNTKVHTNFLDSNGGERSSGVRRKLRFSDSDPELIEKVEINHCKDKKKMKIRFSWKSLFKRRKSKQFGKGIKVITSTPFSNSNHNKKQNSDIWWDEINSCSPAKKARISTIRNNSDELAVVNSNESAFQLKTLSMNQSELTYIKQFKCAVCLAAYNNNSELLKHVKKEHKGLFNILKPQYRCGECEAKFFKNSFLVRHCKFHHTPLCLKKKYV